MAQWLSKEDETVLSYLDTAKVIPRPITGKELEKVYINQKRNWWSQQVVKAKDVQSMISTAKMDGVDIGHIEISGLQVLESYDKLKDM